jgi:hypothetical protein
MKTLALIIIFLTMCTCVPANKSYNRSHSYRVKSKPTAVASINTNTIYYHPSVIVIPATTKFVYNPYYYNSFKRIHVKRNLK